jgi:hypothetical protein
MFGAAEIRNSMVNIFGPEEEQERTSLAQVVFLEFRTLNFFEVGRRMILSTTATD